MEGILGKMPLEHNPQRDLGECIQERAIQKAEMSNVMVLRRSCLWYVQEMTVRFFQKSS